MYSTSEAIAAGQDGLTIRFSYDHLGRRSRKRVWRASDHNDPVLAARLDALGSPSEEIYYVYDGWNLLNELRIDYATRLKNWNVSTDGAITAYGSTSWKTSGQTRSYVWGHDLAGLNQRNFSGVIQPSQDAGGVGGLLACSDSVLGMLTAAYDGNGNVIGWLDGQGQVMGKQEYDPFGQRIIQEGSVSLPVSFSTKYRDEESGLSYYGYRYYDPVNGRWINRDPIGEKGGYNIYEFIGNCSINKLDIFGLKDYRIGKSDPIVGDDAGAGRWGSKNPTVGRAIIYTEVVLTLDDVYPFMPDATAHLAHYFFGEGADYEIRFETMLDEVPSAQRYMLLEVQEAKKFAESLSVGQCDITSGSATTGYNGKSENLNWFYAVGGYRVWGKGKLIVENDRYTLGFAYKFHDRYNWDGKGAGDKGVGILGLPVPDEFMGEFHRQGFAQEFNMYSSVQRRITWCKGDVMPKIEKITTPSR